MRSPVVDLTSFERAPGLPEGSLTAQMGPDDCDLGFWIEQVAQGTWYGLDNGHRPTSVTPAHMLEPGPFRMALMEELAFRSMAEEKATRAISYLVELSPDITTMEFFTTQLVDEARHGRVFREHLLEMGLPRAQLFSTMERLAGADRDGILSPLEKFAYQIGREDRDFIGGVTVLTILVEGVLAPLAELSERKWRPIDPAAADIERGAAVDEIRHLTVGSEVIRRHLLDHPDDRNHVLGVLDRGNTLWGQLPVVDVMVRREELFQQGMEQLPEVVGDYEIEPDRRLRDTTPGDRLGMALDWSNKMRESRLRHMGLAEALG